MAPNSPIFAGLTRRSCLRPNDGFTIIEVLVAATILVTGVLGTMMLIDIANSSSTAANGRNGATSIARSVIEAARGTTSSSLTAANLTATLQAATPDLPDSNSGDSLWTVTRQGYTYTITPSICTLDDPGDGLGAAGTIDSSFCPQATSSQPPDAQPADFRQVKVSVSWKPAPTGSTVTQTVNIPIGSTGTLPQIASLSMTSPSSCSADCPQITSAATTSAAFSAVTTNSPSTFSWVLDGNLRDSCPPVTTCSGSGNNWNFSWSLGTIATDTNTSSINFGKCVTGSYISDGIYRVGARGLTDTGLSGGDVSIPIQLNRCAPRSLTGFVAEEGKRTKNYLDTEWEASTEGDIVGYRVYRASTTTGPRTAVCPASVAAGEVIAPSAGHTCVDPSPPSYSSSSPFYYGVVAVDRDASGALREGAIVFRNVNTGNREPKEATSLSASRSGNTVNLTFTIPPSPDPDAGDTVPSFRVYRKDGAVGGSLSYTDRLTRESVALRCSNSSCTYSDTTAGPTTRSYWVTLVDNRLLESGPGPSRSA